MPDIFGAYKNDDIVLFDNDKNYTLKELKELILSREDFLNENKKVVILNCGNFDFIINFFAAVFLKKEIYLVCDNRKIKDFGFEHQILSKIENLSKKEGKLQEINPDEIIVNFYTSGSSGTPKLIKKTLNNLLFEGEDLKNQFKMKKEHICASTTSMAHLFGMTFHLMFSLMCGFKICTKTINYPLEINHYKDLVFVSTPVFLQSLKKYDTKLENLPSCIISAGSKLDIETFEYLVNLKIKVIEIYGSTETGVIAYKNFPYDEFKIFDNVDVAPFLEYTKVKSKYIFENEIQINDKVEVKGDKIILKKRTDRLLKIFEKRISPVEIEDKLSNNKYIKESYVFKSGGKLACIASLSDEGREFIINGSVFSLIKELKKYLLSDFEIIPQRWKFIDIIPKTQTGKLDKEFIEHLFNVNCSLPVILDRKKSEDEIICKIYFYSGCNFFDGHFRGFKIVPGVIQIFLAKEFANRTFDLTLGEGQYKRIKFSNVIPDNSIVYLKLKKTEKTLDFEYFSSSKTYSKGSFLCENIFKGIKNELI